MSENNSDLVAELVEQMLELRKRFHGLGTSASYRRLPQRQIAATDREIHRLVYELYGLIEHDIAVVEGTSQP